MIFFSNETFHDFFLWTGCVIFLCAERLRHFCAKRLHDFYFCEERLHDFFFVQRGCVCFVVRRGCMTFLC